MGRQLLGARSGGMVASPAYIASRGAPCKLQELAHHKCVTSTHPSGRSNWRLTGPDGLVEEIQVVGRFSGNTAQALREATLAGLGIALLPPAITRLDIQARLLVPILPQYQRTGQGLCVLYPSRPRCRRRLGVHQLMAGKADDVESLPDAFRSEPS